MFDWTFQDSIIPKKNAASDFSFRNRYFENLYSIWLFNYRKSMISKIFLKLNGVLVKP